LQREIANVMAACGLSAIRYVSFPPVVFETPAPKPLPEAEPPALALEPAPEAPQAEPAPQPVLAQPAMAEAPILAPMVAPPPLVTPPLAAAPEAAMPPAAPAMPEPVVRWAEPEPEPSRPTFVPRAPSIPPRAPTPRSGGLRRLAELAEVAAEDYRAPGPAASRQAGAPWPDPGAEDSALTAPAAHHAAHPDAAPPSFALLEDLAGELRPRRVRAKTSRGTKGKSA
jgi:nicotinate-nucleotide--dimethylbenzimidazole phosphoribosyltransferase